MKIDYQETSKDLLKRIDIHSRYGSRDIDQWMLQILAPKAGSRILDVGCGAGKQLKAFYDALGGDVKLVGGDVSQELLAKARGYAEGCGGNVSVIELDFNKRFPIDDNQFDLASCCFAIYYAEDIPHTIREMHRVLAPGGRLFTTGPMPENKKLFYDIIREATQKTIPPMPGSSRYGSLILNEVRTTFSRTDVEIFENPLSFEEVQPFLDYTRASLSEDRKLWSSFFADQTEFEEIMKRIADVADRRLKNDGSLVMTKVVGGFIGTK